MSTESGQHRWSITSLIIALIAMLIPLGSAAAGTVDSPVAMFDPVTAEWHLRFEDGSVHAFTFGEPGDLPLLGDWNCDGLDTIGVYRSGSGLASLRNSNTEGSPDAVFFFGVPRDVAVAGDWNGDGCDTLAIHRPSTSQFFLSDQLATAEANHSFFFGVSGDQPLAGDFSGAGNDGIGVYRPSTGSVYLRNELSTGFADSEFLYGIRGDRIFLGDWDSDGTETVAAFRPGSGRLYLSAANQLNTLSQEVVFGEARWKPVSSSVIAEPSFSLDFDGGSPPTTTAPTTTTSAPPASPVPTTTSTTTAPTVPTSTTTTTTTAPTVPTTTSTTSTTVPLTTTTTPTTMPPTTTTTAPPAEAGVPNQDGSYGPGVKGRWLRPRTPKKMDWALGPWEAPRTGTIDNLALYFIFRYEDTYFKGTGGINRFTVRADANGQPGEFVLGEFTITNPTAPGGIWADWATERGSWSPFEFDNPVPVTGGQKYWIVAENLHPDPVNNWVAIESISSADGAPGTVYVYMETAANSNVFERFEYPNEGLFLGLFDLTYQEGDGFGQGYFHADFGQSVGGAQRAREVFTPSSNQSVSSVQVWAERSGGTGALTMALRSNGTTLAQATATGSGWMTFSINATLQAGNTYSLEFTAPATTTYTFYSLRENASWSAGSRFTDGYADYDDGSGWAGGWPIWDRTSQEGEMMFYFTKSG